MTTKGDSFKTNEFLRLRKLRLQQVREQSKDIAKKIRQRAKVEQLRHVTNVDKNKEKEYLQRQERLVNRLEQLYSKSVQNVGASHKNACEVNDREIPEKIDLSKLRGKEAAAILKRNKQEKLDEQKKLLDRKLQAREVANVLSREKFAALANTLIKSSSGKSANDQAHDKISNFNENAVKDKVEIHKDKCDPVPKNDMGTQWEFEEIPNEWEPNIPKLPIPNDDSLKNSADDNVERSYDQNQKNRRLNLFALSDEMPSSLRGGVSSIPDERLPMKPSLTLVSEYLQNRGLRLREEDTTRLHKKKTDDLQSIKQTLLRTRASRTDGSVFPNICHVLDEQVIPVPHWRAERNCDFCSNVNEHVPRHCKNSEICSDINKHIPQYCKNRIKNAFNKTSFLKPGCQPLSLSYENPKSSLKSQKCRPGIKIPVSGRSNNVEQSNHSDDTNKILNKKNSVTMYDHNTRDTRDLPHNLDKFVVRDQSIADDAYSQALKEDSVVDTIGKPHQTLQQDARNRLALTRQTVDKEYRDTLAFLNSLPKEKPARSVRTAYMDGNREQELKDKHQHKLQDEYKKLEKHSNKHCCKHAGNKSVAREQNRSKSKSPKVNVDNHMVNKDFQYAWLPVPESDGNLAIHTIPNNMKDNKTGNTVKFSSVDTYHEYRSRHKHTPPTKDIDSEPNKRVVEAVIIQENSIDSLDTLSETDTSSIENSQVRQDSPIHKVNKDKQLPEAERIIIYKVMESKKTKKRKIKKKSQNGNNITKKYNFEDKSSGDKHENVISKNDTDKFETNSVSFTQLKEGIYKSVSANGDNIGNLYFSDEQLEKSCNHNARSAIIEKDDSGISTATRAEKGENFLDGKLKPCTKCNNNGSHKHTDKHPSAATSTSSFKTAVNDKDSEVLLDGGYIKFVDDGGKDSGKFYVGASGFLKDNAYEVIIQLRKKEAEINKKVANDNNNTEAKSSTNNNIKENSLRQSTAIPSTNVVISSSKNQNETIKHLSPPRDEPGMLLIKNNTPTHEHTVTLDNNVCPPTEVNENYFKHDKKTVEHPELSNKGISTMFRDSFAISDSVPKLDPISKPVASISTQTTQNSSIPKPVLMHLSSSTSTTYMSPPEIILPRYLRKGSSESCDDTYEPISSNYNFQNTEFTNCKACRCGKNKKREKIGKTNTPPNTTRSTDRTTDNFASDEQCKKLTSESTHKNMMSHKCKKRSDPKIGSKHKFKRSPSENRRLHNGSNYSMLSNKKKRRINNLDKVSLNPVIENYVKKLLALNKEGLKAIEVINQECSTVNTPGSSVIDVPSNINTNRSIVYNKISLEQIKNSLGEQLLKNIGNRKNISKCTVKSIGSQTEKNINLLYKYNKKRSVHKVKSFNVSKQLIKTNKENRRQSAKSTADTISSRKEKCNYTCSNIDKSNSVSENSHTPRQMNNNQEVSNNSFDSERSKDSRKSFLSGDKIKASKTITNMSTDNKQAEMRHKSGSYHFQSEKPTMKSNFSESEASNGVRNHRKLPTIPISISTQTNQVDSEVEFMKLAENKLQNMEKIADLTEKCTKRLSNLAKVLEEVRRNKSLAYSQISDSTSDSDQRSNKNMETNNRAKTFNPSIEIQTLTEALSSMPTSPQEQKSNQKNITAYVPILTDIPIPDTFKTPSPISFSTNTNKKDNSNNIDNTGMEQQFVKNRGKPPPALTRINLKHVPEGFVVPHELSTVVEVDSPMSVKLKTHTTQIENNQDVTDTEIVEDVNLHKMNDVRIALDTRNKSVNSNDLISKSIMSKMRYETQSTDTSDESKIKMMDLKYFNEIMLKPFITLKDYAKQYKLEELDGQTSPNGTSKDENMNEELSSLHSESSIPDVMAELLKRNLISEPFKFETTSNVNSTTVSSESTLSLLALSRARKDKKKSALLIKNKENIGETSVSLSISSNPDLEHAFQKLGMGWASSTLKKTKERLALSSSSNTSSSSIPQFKIKSFNYQEVPEMSTLINISNRGEVLKTQENLSETPRNALQQTSLTNSMTVKEFLTNELANKITFSNKINKNVTEDEFISLCETKIPEEMKNLSQKPEVKDKSVDSLPSGTNNRARTSTPVQIYKSMTYHSTSSSNTSNGLFSNADDLSSVKGTSNSVKNHSTSDKDDLTIPNYSLKTRKEMTEFSKSD